MVDLYATETIGHRRRVDVKDNGTVIFEPARAEPASIIYGMVVHKRRLIRNAKGEEVISEGYILTSQDVREGDLLIIDEREWAVQASHPTKDLMGAVMYWEASL